MTQINTTQSHGFLFKYKSMIDLTKIENSLDEEMTDIHSYLIRIILRLMNNYG